MGPDVLRMRSLALPLLLVFALPGATALGFAGFEVDLGGVETSAHVAAEAPAIGEVVAQPAPGSGVAVSLPTVALLPPTGLVDAIAAPPPMMETEARAPATPADAGGAIAAGASAGAAWLLFGRFLTALYSRMAAPQLLEHERRERVLALVRERPGIGPTEIAAAIGTGWGVTIYHLDRLEKAGLLTSERSGHHRCYFVPGSVAPAQKKTVGMFRVETTRRVAQLVAERPGVTQGEMRAVLGLSASAASKQVTRLESAALVRREAGADGLRLYPQPALPAALAC